MTITLEEGRAYRKKYSNVSCLLLYFHEDTYLEPQDRNGLAVIQTYVSVFDTEVIEDTLKELKEVLALEKFPAEWVQTTANLFPFNDEKQYNDEGYYKWVQWMLETLKIEAQKAGKL